MDRQNWSSVQSAELPRHIYAAAEVEEGSATEDTGAELTAEPPLQSAPPPCTGVWILPSSSRRWG